MKGSVDFDWTVVGVVAIEGDMLRFPPPRNPLTCIDSTSGRASISERPTDFAASFSTTGRRVRPTHEHSH